MIDFNVEEKIVIGELQSIQDKLRGWNLAANHEELAAAIHTIQFFVIMHMLRRENPTVFNDWYSK